MTKPNRILMVTDGESALKLASVVRRLAEAEYERLYQQHDDDKIFDLIHELKEAKQYELADSLHKQWQKSQAVADEVEREYQESVGLPIHLSINNGF